MEENKSSADSVYFNVEIPKDDAFFKGKFKYQITLLGQIDFIESIKPVIVLSKNKIFNKSNLYYYLGLTIQDISPSNCNLNGTCYQRIYFKVFEEQKLNIKFNYFTIHLINFNDCYVEHADVDNQHVFINVNKIYWQNIEFIEVH